MQSKAAYTQLKPSPPKLKTIKHQKCLQSASSKKQTDTSKKNTQLSKEHKTEEASSDLDSSEVSLDEIMEFFKPMLSCISPLPDLVRIQLCFTQMFF